MVQLGVKINKPQPEEEVEEELTNEEREQLQIEEIKRDLNNSFPFAALWQDEQETGLGKLVPMISMIVNIIMLVLVIIILVKK